MTFVRAGLLHIFKNAVAYLSRIIGASVFRHSIHVKVNVAAIHAWKAKLIQEPEHEWFALAGDITHRPINYELIGSKNHFIARKRNAVATKDPNGRVVSLRC